MSRTFQQLYLLTCTGFFLPQAAHSAPVSPASNPRARAQEAPRTTTTATCLGSTCVFLNTLSAGFCACSSQPPPRFQIMILLCNQQSFICTHIDFCHPRCYQHHSRSCARLVRAIKLVYGETVDSLREDSAISGHIMARAKKNKEVGLT